MPRMPNWEIIYDAVAEQVMVFLEAHPGCGGCLSMG